MILNYSDRDCMWFEKVVTERLRKEIKIPVDRQTPQGVQKLTKKQIAELIFEYCLDCEKMAAVPQSAFAVNKVRCNYNCNDIGTSSTKEKEKAYKEFTHNARETFQNRDLTPLKYNSKLMNSIWGLYNRYSVHNFKKNNDANEGGLSAVWGVVVPNHPSAASTSIIPTSTAAQTS